MSNNVEKIVRDNMDEIIKSFNRSLKRKGLSGKISISAIHFTEPNNIVGRHCRDVNVCKKVRDPLTGQWTTVCTTEVRCD